VGGVADQTDGEPEFREEQSMRQSRFKWLLVVPVVMFATIVIDTVVEKGGLYRPWHHEAVLALVADVGAFAICLVLSWWVLSARLVTEVRETGLHLRFHRMFLSRFIPYEQIQHCEARAYPPVWKYAGWGHDALYNVRGNRGVQLELADSKRLLIGSQRADELAAAVQRHLGGPV